jgi:hypothetical protein
MLTFGIYTSSSSCAGCVITNARRLELLDAATAVAWQQAGRHRLQQELAHPSSRIAAQLTVLGG